MFLLPVVFLPQHKLKKKNLKQNTAELLLENYMQLYDICVLYIVHIFFFIFLNTLVSAEIVMLIALMRGTEGFKSFLSLQDKPIILKRYGRRMTYITELCHERAGITLNS